MLKRANNIIILIILLVSTTGLTISKHYSKNELFDVAIIGEAESCCSEGPCDCCRDEFEFFRLEVNFIGSNFRFSFDKVQSTDLLFINLSTNIQVSLESFSDDVKYATDLPPPDYLSSSPFIQSFLL